MRELRSFVSHTVTAYTKELARNADLKRAELSKIKNDKKTADELQELIESLKTDLSLIEPAQKRVE